MALVLVVVVLLIVVVGVGVGVGQCLGVDTSLTEPSVVMIILCA